MKLSATVAAVTSLLVLSSPSSPAKSKPGSAAMRANPARYAAFAQPLDKDQQARHALDRLTFGPRRGDLAELQRLGLKHWTDQQLHPERLPENPALEEKLRPFVSTRMGIRETYLQYPPPQLIAQVARGRGILPDDPELRAIVLRLAERYRVKTQPPVQTASAASDPNDDSDLDPAVALTAILTSQQIDTLKNGKPEEKKAVLESIPPEELTDFVYALHKQQRQQLIALAPVELRRRLVLAVSPQQVVAQDLIESKLLRAIYSNHQLDEL